MTNPQAPSLLGSNRRRQLTIALPAVVALVLAAYWAGRGHPPVTVRHGNALSAVGAISVEVDGAIRFSIPTDVAWIDSAGSYHQDGRPECLPPVGIGNIAVTFATVKVKDPSAAQRDQTIWVDCTGWDPAEDLTPEQAANAKIDGEVE